MRNSNKIYLFILLFLLLSMRCKNSLDSEVKPPVDQNLIENPSFEDAYGPSIHGWSFRDSTIYGFYPDAPNGGGRYSIVLRTVWRGYFSFNAVMTRVGLVKGQHRYLLSCWGKRLPRGEGALHLFLGTGNVDTMTAVVTIPIVDSLWTFYSTEVVIANNSNDSAVVTLHGGYSPIEYPADSTFFDLCKFERLD